MTPEAQMALIAAIIPTVASIGAIMVAWHGKTSNKKETDDLKQDNKVADKKIDHIVELTNSNLASANERIKLLEDLVHKLIKEKSETKAKSTIETTAVVDVKDVVKP